MQKYTYYHLYVYVYNNIEAPLVLTMQRVNHDLEGASDEDYKLKHSQPLSPPPPSDIFSEIREKNLH